MKSIKTKLENLDELIRKADSLISPLTVDQRLSWLLNKDFRTKHFEQHPKCYIMMKRGGRDLPFFPICNRMGSEDPEVIKMSKAMANRLRGKEDIDQDELDTIIVKLSNIEKKFNKDIPKPQDMATKKAFVSRYIKKIRKYIDNI